MMMMTQQVLITGLKLSSGLNLSKCFGLLSPKLGQFHRQIQSVSSRSKGLISIPAESNFYSIRQQSLSLSPIGTIFQPLILPKRDLSKAKSSEQNGHMVYMGRVRKMFRNLKIFSLATSAFGLLLQPYLWYSVQDLSLLATVPLFAAVNTFVFTNPILIHFLSKRYVNELYFNPTTKEFTAIVLTFFARKETLTFTANDVNVPDVPGMFSMLTVRDRPLFVDERDFTSIEVYKHLMGFDRPLDLRHVSNPSKQDERIE